MPKYTLALTKILYLFFFVLIIGNTAFAIDVEYIVNIDNPSSGQANIKMIVTSLSSESLSVSSWSYSLSDPKIDLLTITAKDKNGNNLPLNAFPTNDPYEWTINTAGLSKCIIEYTIEPKAHKNYWEPDGNKYYSAYISQDFTVAPAWTTFLIPVNGSWIKPNIIKISLNIPNNWQILTPWPWRDGFYYPLEIPSVNWYNYFHNTFFWLGHFNSYKKKIGNSDITVSFYGVWPSNFKQESVENIWDLYSYFSSVWGSSLDYPYFVLFYPKSVNGDLILGLQHELGQAISLESDPNQINWADKAHEICETRWINFDWGFLNNDCLWAKTGFSYLYAQKSNAKTRINTLQFLEGNISSGYDNYLQRVRDGTDLPLASDQADSDKDLSFNKGTSAVLLIAREIYIRTGGTKTFDDLNKQLFNKYWSKGTYLQEPELKTEINALTGTDFTKFFNDYIYGTKLLPLDWMLEDTDGEGLSNLSEFFWDTNPEKIDTDGDGYSDSVEIDNHSDPLDPTSIPGQFVDVPPGYWAEEAIYKIYEAGITTGCSKNPLKYCPLRDVNRAQMAVFLERGINSGDYTPPPATGIFDDVPVTHWAADWIEQLYKDGITTGCAKSPLKYCPDRAVNRAQMAVFLLRAKHGKNYTPPMAAGIFDDVPVTYWAADWIEQLYKEGITTGCSTNPLKYCPLKVVTRAQMAVFLARTFGL